MISGLPLRATTIRSGKSTWTTATPYVPWIRPSASATLPSRVSASDRATRWASTSVSVSDTRSTPASPSSSRSAAALSMIPLCTTATSSLLSVCGCALTSLAGPWVAQRVWPMPTLPVNRFGSCSLRSRTRPARLATRIPEGPSTATPAES